MMALDNTFLFSTHPLGHGDANELLNPLEMECTLGGILEDDTFSWVESSKRRRLAPSRLNDGFPMGEDLNDILQSFWDSSGCGEISNGTNGTEQGRSLLLEGPTVQPITLTSPQFHEESLSSDSSQIESLTLDPPIKQASWSIPQVILSPSIPFKNENFTRKEIERERGNNRKKKLKIGTISPFVVVKPGGLEGCVTLDEINRKLLTRPAKPVRHPVGEFACVPRVSTSGPGLSGKNVVSLVRIHTKGNGTITIIRTRE
ncbi:Protein XRI1 [Carex littledalei]|uniref:Protein XRI1 n=1 Tax=Carex littledalei TaxID=544730 RepID=A0A833QLE6_9POAL|nr:Protein XRI1 [Carex littledalei]